MPHEIGPLTLWISVTVAALLVFWSRGGFIWVGLKLGLLEPAPERLKRIAGEISARMNVPLSEVLSVRSPLAQAYALPGLRKLLFTQRLLALLTDDEVAAICAHELAHLTESRKARYSRSIRRLTYLPWIYFNPLIHTCGTLAFFGLMFVTIFAPRIYKDISRKLESRADQMAKANEGDAGTYARALTRIYQDNFLPAVTSNKHTTHPHLYERLLDAGVTPDFPRPVAARSMAWHGHVFAGLGGVLFAIFAIKQMQIFGN
ncbi:MAG TPA: M48 family metalloprotease [Candidatus Angelobacter sp.]|nr:M48 family metalloprotease [Candidatus Angelobacter sp.]